MRREKIVITGAGPSGCAAAVQCARLGIIPLLIDRSGDAGGLIENAFLVENYPGPEVPLPGSEFAKRLRDSLIRFGMKVEELALKRITAIDDGYLLETNNGRMTARCVIAAVGTEPRKLGLPGEEKLAGSLVFYEVRSALRLHPRRAIIIGGGEAACDYSLSLAAAGCKTMICIRGKAPRARGRLPALAKANRAITFLPETVPTGISADGDEAVLTARSRDAVVTLQADALLVAIGRRSFADELAPGLIGRSGTVSLEATPGLFVAGDARLGSLGQLGNAVGDGVMAAVKAVDYLEKRGLLNA